MSLAECKLVCGKDSILWPRPREAKLGKSIAHFHTDDVFFINEDEFAVKYYVAVIQESQQY
jgi:hypothetical protein